MLKHSAANKKKFTILLRRVLKLHLEKILLNIGYISFNIVTLSLKLFKCILFI